MAANSMLATSRPAVNFQGGPDQGGVRGGADVFGDGHLDVAVGVTGAQPVADGGDLGGQVGVLELHPGS
jgi:hypothetical protein